LDDNPGADRSAHRCGPIGVGGPLRLRTVAGHCARAVSARPGPPAGAPGPSGFFVTQVACPVFSVIL